MLKFLRKYNKFLLAGFGTVLLLTWLVPSAVTEFSRQSGAVNATWATLGDGEVLTVAQLQQAQRQLKALDAMGVPLLSSLGAERDPATWVLLVREARQAGFVGGVGEGQRVLASMEAQGNAKPEEMLGRLCSASGMQPQAVLETLAELQGVARMLSMAMNAARLSDVRLEVKAAEAMSGVAADVVVLSASQPLPQDDPAPTPERMEALLKEFGATEPGKGRGGLGYRQPDRASLEWFCVPAASVRASLENDPALSGVALRKAFLRDPMRFGAPAGDATATFDAFKKNYAWKVLATGPNHSIQLKTGRLVVPVWLSTGEGGNAHRPSVTATIYSDDQGKTWKTGDIAVPCTDEWINPNETVAIELNDGRVMLNVRSESKAHRRLVVTSPDGASNWSTPKFDDALLEPICMGGIVRYHHGGQSLILFSNPHNLDKAQGKTEPGKNRDRKNLSVKLSRDEGGTWAVNKRLEDGPGAYSDLAVTKDGTILCFYGRAGDGKGMTAWSGGRLTLARFNLEWLLQP